MGWTRPIFISPKPADNLRFEVVPDVDTPGAVKYIAHRMPTLTGTMWYEVRSRSISGDVMWDAIIMCNYTISDCNTSVTWVGGRCRHTPEEALDACLIDYRKSI